MSFLMCTTFNIIYLFYFDVFKFVCVSKRATFYMINLRLSLILCECVCVREKAYISIIFLFDFQRKYSVFFFPSRTQPNKRWQSISHTLYFVAFWMATVTHSFKRICMFEFLSRIPKRDTYKRFSFCICSLSASGGEEPSLFFFFSLLCQ